MFRRDTGLIPLMGSGDFLDEIVGDGIDVTPKPNGSALSTIGHYAKKAAPYVIGTGVVIAGVVLGRNLYNRMTALEPKPQEYKTSGSEPNEEELFS